MKHGEGITLNILRSLSMEIISSSESEDQIIVSSEYFSYQKEYILAIGCLGLITENLHS